MCSRAREAICGFWKGSIFGLWEGTTDTWSHMLSCDLGVQLWPFLLSGIWKWDYKIPSLEGGNGRELGGGNKKQFYMTLHAVTRHEQVSTHFLSVAVHELGSQMSSCVASILELTKETSFDITFSYSLVHRHIDTMLPPTLLGLLSAWHRCVWQWRHLSLDTL